MEEEEKKRRRCIHNAAAATAFSDPVPLDPKRPVWDCCMSDGSVHVGGKHLMSFGELKATLSLLITTNTGCEDEVAALSWSLFCNCSQHAGAEPATTPRLQQVVQLISTASKMQQEIACLWNSVSRCLVYKVETFSQSQRRAFECPPSIHHLPLELPSSGELLPRTHLPHCSCIACGSVRSGRRLAYPFPQIHERDFILFPKKKMLFSESV